MIRIAVGAVGCSEGHLHNGAEGVESIGWKRAVDIGRGGLGAQRPTFETRGTLFWAYKVFFVGIDSPDLGGVIGRAGGKVLHVGRNKYAGKVLFVSAEVGDRDELSCLAVLKHTPEINVTLDKSV